MLDSIKSIWGILQSFMGFNQKAAAVKDRIIEEGHGIRSKDEFVPAMERVIQSFFPDGKMDDVFKEALNHPKVKEIQSMQVEDAKTKAVPILGELVSQNIPVLSNFLGQAK